MTQARWQRGDEVVWRSRPDGTIGYVFAAVVAEDSAEAIALFQPAGGPCKRRTGARGGPGGRLMLPHVWARWQPDPAWPVPSMPRDWNVPFDPPP